MPLSLALPRELERLLIQLSDNHDLLGIEAWRLVEVADTDGDGAVDVVRVEWASGEVWIWTKGPGGATFRVGVRPL